MTDITIHMRQNDGLENYLQIQEIVSMAGVRLQFQEAPGLSGRVHMYGSIRMKILRQSLINKCWKSARIMDFPRLKFYSKLMKTSKNFHTKTEENTSSL